MTDAKPNPEQIEARRVLRGLRRPGWRVDLTTFGACAFEGRAPRLWLSQYGAQWYAHGWAPEAWGSAATAAEAVARIVAMGKQRVPICADD